MATLTKSKNKKQQGIAGKAITAGKIAGKAIGHMLNGTKKKTLTQMFEDGLKDIYSAEKQLATALPKMVEAAENEDLQDAFNHHLAQTKKHIERLEKVFNRLGIDGKGETCEAMEGLIKENDKIIKEYAKNAVRDSALIIGAQKVEHYEIASYGSLCELADVLGYYKISDLLGRTLDEEEQTDHLLTNIAMDVNDEAVEFEDFEEEEEEVEEEGVEEEEEVER